MKVIWSKEALKRLIEIEEFIGRDSEEKAENFIDYLIERGDSISNNPKIGRVVPEISNQNIRELIVKKYRIVYRLENNRIEILTVFEGHRLLRVNEIDNE